MDKPSQPQNNRSTDIQNTRTSATTSTATHSQPAATPPQVFVRWTDLPEDISYQVMYWAMLKEASLSGHSALCSSSKSFIEAGKNFQNHWLFKSAQSSLIHTSLIENTRSYLDSLGYRPQYESPADIGHLNTILNWMRNKSFARMVYLWLNENTKGAFSDPDYLQAFRSYQPESLQLCVSFNTPSTQIASEVAKALPKKTNLNLQIDVKNNPDGETFAKLLEAACSGARITSITIRVDDDLLVNPVARKAMLDVLCGGGTMSHVSLGYVNRPDPFLEDLAARFQKLRYVRLLTLYCPNTPANPVLESLVAAMAQRQALGLPKVTIVLNEFMPLSAKEKDRLEVLGLFIGGFDGSFSYTPLLDKIRRSVGEGPMCEWIKPTKSVAAIEEDTSEDSIVVVVDNEDDSSADSEYDDVEVAKEESETAAPLGTEDQVRLVNRKKDRKKDRCVIG